MCVVNLNASPYNRGRRAERLAMLSGRVAEAGCAIAYVNQVGGQDELVFDGDSLVVAADGTLLGSGAQFAEDLVVVDLPIGSHPTARGDRAAAARAVVTAPRRGDRLPLAARPARPVLSDHAEVYAALVLGTRDYLGKNGFSEAVIGLSGGIDSSLVAAVAVDALGAERVHGISMPSRTRAKARADDAGALAERLGIDLKTVAIEEAHVAFSSMLAPLLGREPFGLTDENLQSRLRGVLLMAVSNAKGWIVLTTGNKSEMATGYSTLYGDSAGGFAVIKDVPKTLVYELCRYRNTQAVLEGLPGPIPDSVLDKPPSAELRPDQRDDQSLPPYEELDPVLQGYVEGDRTAADLVAEGFDPAVVDQVVRLVDGAEYKRRQMPPGVRITTKAFGKDRRMPITEPLPLLGARGAGRNPVGLRWTPGPRAWRGIDELAGLVGVYCWVEERIFEISGAWASGVGPGTMRTPMAALDPALRVWCCRRVPAATASSPPAGPSDCPCGRAWNGPLWSRRRPALAGALGAMAATRCHGGSGDAGPVRVAPPAGRLRPAPPHGVPGQRGFGHGGPGGGTGGSWPGEIADGRPCCRGALRAYGDAALAPGIEQRLPKRVFSLLYPHLDSAITLSKRLRTPGIGRGWVLQSSATARPGSPAVAMGRKVWQDLGEGTNRARRRGPRPALPHRHRPVPAADEGRRGPAGPGHRGRARRRGGAGQGTQGVVDGQERASCAGPSWRASRPSRPSCSRTCAWSSPSPRSTRRPDCRCWT